MTNDNYSAFPLWKLAAERGDATAKYNLGLCYHNGWGAPKDDNQALYWWRQAGAEGNEDARHNAQILERELSGGNNYSSNSDQSTSSKRSGGCYIATAVYGSYDCPQVWTLRRYRDMSLAKNFYGRAFIKIYYALSPTAIKLFGKTKWFQHFWKKKLDRMVYKLNRLGFEDTPYNDTK